MATIDHIILRVKNATESALFYSSVLGFTHEGRFGPFEVMRVNDGLTLDLMQMPLGDPQHLAFELSEHEFEEAFERIRSRDIPYGDDPFSRTSQGAGIAHGARGNATVLYFSDPSGNSLEIRLYRRPQA